MRARVSLAGEPRGGGSGEVHHVEPIAGAFGRAKATPTTAPAAARHAGGLGELGEGAGRKLGWLAGWPGGGARRELLGSRGRSCGLAGR